MPLKVRCFYCGASKSLALGTVVSLSCDHCSSSRVVLERAATFRCVLCRSEFRLPAGRMVSASHDVEHCRGRALILLDVE
jgi:ribosomal protein S27E